MAQQRDATAGHQERADHLATELAAARATLAAVTEERDQWRRRWADRPNDRSGPE